MLNDLDNAEEEAQAGRLGGWGAGSEEWVMPLWPAMPLCAQYHSTSF